jgi:AcrR family transcriptional regulator
MEQGYATATAKRRPLRRDAERNRLLILSAARTVFAQRGLEASLDEVAREAGLGVGTVYRRFPNRDALIDALFADGINTITRVVEESLAMPRAWDGLRHFMASMLQLQCGDKGLRDVMLSHRGPDPAEDLLRDRIKPPLYDLVRRAQREGDLRADLSATDIGVLEVAALGAAELTAGARPDVWSRYLTIIMDGMRARPDDAACGNTPLEAPPLDDDQLDECMAGWKYGTREASRHRPRPAA